MPGYKTHLFGGGTAFLCGIFLFYAFIPCHSFSVIVELLLSTLIGSLFPDIDTKSKAQLFCYRILFICIIYLIIQQSFVLVGLLALIAMVPLIVHHRGIFHQLPFLCISVVCVMSFFYIFVPILFIRIAFDLIFFLIGAVSHLLLDLGIRRTFGF